MAAAPAAAWFAILELMLLSAVALLIFMWLVRVTFSWIPGVGHLAVRASDAVSAWMHNKIEDWLEPQLHTMLSWFATLATRVLGYPRAVYDALTNVDDALRHLVETKIGQLIAVATKQLHLDITWLKTHMTKAETALGHVPGLIEQRLSAYGEALTRALLKQFENGIERLRRDVVEPGLHEAESVAHDAAAIAGKTRTELHDLAKRLDIPLSLLEELVAAVGVVAALEAVRTLGTCRGKLRTLCTSDPMRWEQFILGLAAVGFLFNLEEMALVARGLIDVTESVVKQAA